MYVQVPWVISKLKIVQERKRGPRSELLEENPRTLLLQFSLRRCHSCADLPILLLFSVACG